MPTISVVIPAYNSEKTIKETIDSVLNQTYSDLELIVVNDGSTDATLDVILTIDDSRVKVFSHPNSGAPVSRNRGLTESKGEYISFLDADDLWTPEKLDTQLNALFRNPNAALAYSWTDRINEGSQFVCHGSQFSFTGYVLPQLLLTDIVGNGSNPLIRKLALEKVGGFDEQLPNAQDWDLWLRLAAHHEFTVVPSVHVLYRVTANSMSSPKYVLRMEAASLRVLERAFAEAPESLQHLKNYSFANRYKYLTYQALEGIPDRKRAIAATRLLWLSIRYDLTSLRPTIIVKVILKILVILLLPKQQAQAAFSRFKGLFNTRTLLGYLRLDAPTFNNNSLVERKQ